MDTFSLNNSSHRRLNLLTGEWVLVSPRRTQRPWSGQLEKTVTGIIAPYSPDCYLCPGNRRANGAVNPSYATTFVFDNDFAALLPGRTRLKAEQTDKLLQAEPEQGICRVICYSPRHDLTLGRLPKENILDVITTWVDQTKDLSNHKNVSSIQIFENRGTMMGCSNPHPHGQIWATSSLPTLVAREGNRQENFFSRDKSCLLCNYLQREEKEGDRLLFSNDSFAVLVPFWAIWPFETLIIPRFHDPSILTMNSGRKKDLAEILIRLETAYDNLFDLTFPFSMGIHQQPWNDGSAHPEWHWHIHYYPPLLRSGSVKKHMVGFEMLAMAQRDISPEEATQRLRETAAVHFMDREEGV